MKKFIKKIVTGVFASALLFVVFLHIVSAQSAGSIELISPNGGEVITSGTETAIHWKQGGYDSSGVLGLRLIDTIGLQYLSTVGMPYGTNPQQCWQYPYLRFASSNGCAGITDESATLYFGTSTGISFGKYKIAINCFDKEGSGENCNYDSEQDVSDGYIQLLPPKGALPFVYVTRVDTGAKTLILGQSALIEKFIFDTTLSKEDLNLKRFRIGLIPGSNTDYTLGYPLFKDCGLYTSSNQKVAYSNYDGSAGVHFIFNDGYSILKGIQTSLSLKCNLPTEGINSGTYFRTVIYNSYSPLVIAYGTQSGQFVSTGKEPYQGQQITLTSTSQPISYPCYNFAANLTTGSTGADVVALQTFLISNSFHIPSIENGTAVKGTIGPETIAALSFFQSRVGILENYFGPLTRSWMNGHTSCKSITLNKSLLASSYKVGDSIPIKWTSVGINNVNINLMNYKGVSVVRKIATVQALAGQYSWIVPRDIDFADDTIYVISVSDASSTSIISKSGKIELLPTTTPTSEVIISNATAVLGSPVLSNNVTVAYPVSFSFTLSAGNNSVYLGTAVDQAQYSPYHFASGTGTIMPRLVSTTASPANIAGDFLTGTTTGYYIIPAGSSRTFTVAGVLSIYDATRGGGFNYVKMTAIDYGNTITGSLHANSITSGLGDLAVTVFFSDAPTVSPAPTAKITIGGQKSYTYTVGQTNHFAWYGTNANSYSSYAKANNPLQCGEGAWVANNAQGSSDTYLDSKWAGCTWTVTYVAKNTTTGQSASDSVTLSVVPQTFSAVLLRVDESSPLAKTVTVNHPEDASYTGLPVLAFNLKSPVNAYLRSVNVRFSALPGAAKAYLYTGQALISTVDVIGGVASFKNLNGPASSYSSIPYTIMVDVYGVNTGSVEFSTWINSSDVVVQNSSDVSLDITGSVQGNKMTVIAAQTNTTTPIPTIPVVTTQVMTSTSVPTMQSISILPWSGPSSVLAGQPLQYTLNWSGGPTTPSSNGMEWKVFVHIERQGGGGSFGGGFYPRTYTTAWTGGTVSTPDTILVPANTPAGTYNVYVGFYSGTERLALNPINGAVAENSTSRRYKVGTVTVTVPSSTQTAPTDTSMANSFAALIFEAIGKLLGK